MLFVYGKPRPPNKRRNTTQVEVYLAALHGLRNLASASGASTGPSASSTPSVFSPPCLRFTFALTQWTWEVRYCTVAPCLGHLRSSQHTLLVRVFNTALPPLSPWPLPPISSGSLTHSSSLEFPPYLFLHLPYALHSTLSHTRPHYPLGISGHTQGERNIPTHTHAHKYPNTQIHTTTLPPHTHTHTHTPPTCIPLMEIPLPMGTQLSMETVL